MTAVMRIVVLGGLCCGLAAWAADPPTPDLKGKQAQNAEQFRLIKDQLLKLAQKLAVSDKPAERERAKVILAALELAARENLDGQFKALVGELSKDASSVQDLEKAIGRDGQLLKALQDMLSLLLTDDEAMRQKDEIKRLAESLKEARDIVRAQETLRAMTDAQKADAAKLAKAQKDLADRTKALAERMGGKKTDKQGEPKPGDKKKSKEGEPTDAKKGEGKDSDGKSKDGKSGEPKDGKQGEKGGKPSDGKSGKTKDGKSGETKDGKSGDKKSTDGKQDEPKGGKPNDGKQGETKDGKSADAKPKDGKSSDGKSADGKPKDGKSGKPSDGKQSQPKDGQQPSGDKQQSEQPQNDQPTPQMPGRQRIEQAVPQQKGASDDMKEQKRPDAGKKQDKAIDELNKAIQELEKRLKQLREEEAMRQLAGLEARCNRMLQLQTAVYEATKAIDGAVQKAGGTKGTADIQKAQTQADREREIVQEADKTLDLLKAEGSAVAFAGVLQEVRVDMAGVQQRLTGADVGPVTQEVEANIIALLKEMAAALKKQQQDMQQQKQQQQQNPQSGPQPSQALVNKIAELKLIRSLQTQVNSRTKLVGAKSPGEQTSDPQTAADLKALAARQARIEEMLTALATGANQ